MSKVPKTTSLMSDEVDFVTFFDGLTRHTQSTQTKVHFNISRKKLGNVVDFFACR